MKMISSISLVEMQNTDREVVRAPRLSWFHQIPDLFCFEDLLLLQVLLNSAFRFDTLCGLHSSRCEDVTIFPL